MSLIGSIQGLGANLFGTQQTEQLKASQRFKEINEATGGQTLESLQKSGQTDAVNRIHGVEPTPSFGDMLQGLVEQVDAKQKASIAETNKLLAGETDSIHQSMIASQEASVAFSLMVEVRNKLMEGYNSLMKMQG